MRRTRHGTRSAPACSPTAASPREAREPLATGGTDPRELAGAFAGFARWARLSAALKDGRPGPDALWLAVHELLDLRHVPLGVERRCSAQALLRSVQAALVHQRHAPIEVPTAVEREPKEPAASAPQT